MSVFSCYVMYYCIDVRLLHLNKDYLLTYPTPHAKRHLDRSSHFCRIPDRYVHRRTHAETTPHLSSNRPHLYAIRCSLKMNMKLYALVASSVSLFICTFRLSYVLIYPQRLCLRKLCLSSSSSTEGEKN